MDVVNDLDPLRELCYSEHAILPCPHWAHRLVAWVVGSILCNCSPSGNSQSWLMTSLSVLDCRYMITARDHLLFRKGCIYTEFVGCTRIWFGFSVVIMFLVRIEVAQLDLYHANSTPSKWLYLPLEDWFLPHFRCIQVIPSFLDKLAWVTSAWLATLKRSDIQREPSMYLMALNSVIL